VGWHPWPEVPLHVVPERTGGCLSGSYRPPPWPREYPMNAVHMQDFRRGPFICSSSARRAMVVRPPRQRRHRQWRSLTRTDPAGHRKSAWFQESIRLTTTVGDLQGDIFIEGSALNWIPARTHLRFSPFQGVVCHSGAVASLVPCHMSRMRPERSHCETGWPGMKPSTQHRSRMEVESRLWRQIALSEARQDETPPKSMTPFRSARPTRGRAGRARAVIVGV
jgi:hypothetical protein